MSRSRRQPAPTSPQQATGARVPAMAAPVSGPGTSAIPQPSSHQLEALERPGPRQPPTPFPTSAKSMAQYNPSFGLANAAGPIVPHSAPTGYAGRQVSNSPIALHATPFAPWSGGLGEQCVNPAALQPDGVSGTSSRPIAIPWAPAIYEGRDPPAQRPINHRELLRNAWLRHTDDCYQIFTPWMECYPVQSPLKYLIATLGPSSDPMTLASSQMTSTHHFARPNWSWVSRAHGRKEKASTALAGLARLLRSKR